MALPPDTPIEPAEQPLAATGPYMIERYERNELVLMTRNPHFHEWSAAAQPDGFPDRIEIRKFCRWCGRHTPHKETR